jgi:hypothetical protein
MTRGLVARFRPSPAAHRENLERSEKELGFDAVMIYGGGQRSWIKGRVVKLEMMLLK